MEGGGQKWLIFRRHNLWTTPYMVISNLIALEIRKKHVSTYTVLQSAVIELVPLCNDQQTIPAVITQ